MQHKTLLSDFKSVDSATVTDKVSSMYLLSEDQVLMARYITSMHDVLIPPLDNALLAVHLGGKQITTPVVSRPSNLTFVPPRKETTPCLFGGNMDITFFLVAGEAKKNLLACINNNERLRFSDPIIPAIARQLTAESVREDRDDTHCNSLMEALLQQLMHLLKGKQVPQIDTTSSHHQQIKAAINYIHKNLSDPLTIDQLAQFVETDPSRFRKLFKQVVGTTVRQYVMTQRLEAARDLLINTDLPLLQLADETGFSSQSHFTESFRKVYDVTPLQYRKAVPC
jgi:AraC family transcriptional regulator